MKQLKLSPARLNLFLSLFPGSGFQFQWIIRGGIVIWALALGLPLVVLSVSTPPPPEDIQTRVRYVINPSGPQGFTPVTFSYNFTTHRFRIETSLPIQSYTLQPHAPLDPEAFPNCPLHVTHQGAPGNDWEVVPECLAPLCLQRGVRLTCQTDMGEIQSVLLPHVSESGDGGGSTGDIVLKRVEVAPASGGEVIFPGSVLRVKYSFSRSTPPLVFPENQEARLYFAVTGSSLPVPALFPVDETGKGEFLFRLPVTELMANPFMYPIDTNTNQISPPLDAFQLVLAALPDPPPTSAAEIQNFLNTHRVPHPGQLSVVVHEEGPRTVAIDDKVNGVNADLSLLNPAMAPPYRYLRLADLPPPGPPVGNGPSLALQMQNGIPCLTAQGVEPSDQLLVYNKGYLASCLSWEEVPRLPDGRVRLDAIWMGSAPVNSGGSPIHIVLFRNLNTAHHLQLPYSALPDQCMHTAVYDMEDYYACEREFPGSPPSPPTGPVWRQAKLVFTGFCSNGNYTNPPDEFSKSLWDVYVPPPTQTIPPAASGGWALRTARLSYADFEPIELAVWIPTTATANADGWVSYTITRSWEAPPEKELTYMRAFLPMTWNFFGRKGQWNYYICPPFMASGPNGYSGMAATSVPHTILRLTLSTGAVWKVAVNTSIGGLKAKQSPSSPGMGTCQTPPIPDTHLPTFFRPFGNTDTSGWVYLYYPYGYWNSGSYPAEQGCRRALLNIRGEVINPPDPLPEPSQSQSQQKNSTTNSGEGTLPFLHFFHAGGFHMRHGAGGGQGGGGGGGGGGGRGDGGQGGSGRDGSLLYEAHIFHRIRPDFAPPGPCPPFNPQVQVQPTKIPAGTTTNVTVSIPPGPFTNGLIESGNVKLTFTASGSYSLSIPPGTNSRRLKITFFRGNCPPHYLSFVLERDRLPVKAWQIEVEPNFPVITNHQQGLYWTGASYVMGLQKLWWLSYQYQKKFGDQLPASPPLPSRHGLCFPFEATTFGVRSSVSEMPETQRFP